MFRPGTRAAHARALKVYVIFSKYYSVDYKNPNVEHVLAFIQYVRPHMKSPASMRNMIGSLSTAFKRAGLDSSIFSSFKENSALRSLDINSRYILSPKLPITPHQLELVIQDMRRAHLDPAIICTITFSFVGLFRQSNLAPRREAEFDHTCHLTREDVARTRGGLQANIKWPSATSFPWRLMLT